MMQLPKISKTTAYCYEEKKIVYIELSFFFPQILPKRHHVKSISCFGKFTLILFKSKSEWQRYLFSTSTIETKYNCKWSCNSWLSKTQFTHQS